MSIQYTDTQVRVLIEEPKPLPEDFRQRLLLRQKRGHREQQLDVGGTQGGSLRVILRQTAENALDFSAILACLGERSTSTFRLRRYNGKSHEHTNLIERQRFYDFHVHTATARYQELGAREDAFAEEAGREHQHTVG